MPQPNTLFQQGRPQSRRPPHKNTPRKEVREMASVDQVFTRETFEEIKLLLEVANLAVPPSVGRQSGDEPNPTRRDINQTALQAANAKLVWWREQM